MPDTVATASTHEYGGLGATAAMGNAGQNASLGASGVGGVVGAVKDAVGTVGGNMVGNKPTNFNEPATAEAVGQAAESSGQLGAGFTDLLLKSMGVAKNPHIEMVYQQTQQRQHNFIFDLIPRSQKEAVAIYNIINLFKAFAAPEVTNQSGGRYLIPPAQFDIKFYFMNKENQAIYRISTCVLNSVQYSYNPSGNWATFNDGVPLHIRLELSFTEVDVLTRELIQQFGY